MSGINDPAPSNGGDANTVDRGAAEDLADRANALYYQVMDMNMDFQESTAGAKVAKDQSGKVSA